MNNTGNHLVNSKKIYKASNKNITYHRASVGFSSLTLFGTLCTSFFVSTKTSFFVVPK